MSRPWFERVFAAFVLLWFVVVATEPETIHRCPVHGPPATASDVAGHGDATHAHHPSAPTSDASSCTCIGDCSAGGLSVAIATANERLVAITGESAGPRLKTEHPRIVPPDFLLPYANGPPRTRGLA